MEITEEIFRQYDIRGIVEKDLDREVAFLLGRAFSVYLKGINPKARKVSLGRDVRLSSGELASGIMDGMVSSGLDVVDIGICPTPLQYFSLYHLDLDGGIMVTGSHNPPEYNGFKLSSGKGTIHSEAIQEIKQIIKNRDAVNYGEARGQACRYEIIPAYREYMLKEFSYLADPGFRRIKVVVDAGNGTAGLVAPDILGRIGCDVTPLYCEPDGRFPNHHPDPTVVEYLQDLVAATRESGAGLGVGYDGDADRIGVIDHEGNVIWGDQLMIVLARDLLARHPGATIIGDVKCSQRMFEDIKMRGGVPIMWKTGHSLVKQKMKEEGALLAGEFSGHIFIADRYFGYDDAIFTTLRLVEIMKKGGRDIRELLSDVPAMCFTPEIRMDCPEDLKKTAMEGVVKRFLLYRENGKSPYPIKDVNTVDGVRVAFDKGWGLVRMSNTQPVMVMRFEAEDEKSLTSYRQFIERELQHAMSDSQT
ncbi:MAG TPA: phosphomannomutase/phosphoglucomutase [Thermodesulfovibrionales bacterium]|nr:phosphomannomutase/phosphoglucomutase [Thermodesulfovibrionales bacterium]